MYTTILIFYIKVVMQFVSQKSISNAMSSKLKGRRLQFIFWITLERGKGCGGGGSLKQQRKNYE